MLYYNIENMFKKIDVNKENEEILNEEIENFRGHRHHHNHYFKNNHISMNYVILFLAIFMFFTSIMILLLKKM